MTTDDCDHTFEEYDTDLVENIRNAGYGDVDNVPKRLEVELICTKCGEDVLIEYNLALIDGKIAT